jgi:FixJ family two-component response regulator
MSTPAATVFVVDDDASVRRALARSMQAAGLNAKLFASAHEFLDQAPLQGPGCLVLDINMPGLNGLELQTELNSRNIQTPIIFMTGHGSIPATVKAMKGGAVDFLTKPFKPRNLLAVIKEALKKDERLQVARMEKAGIQARIQSLTPREREVLGLVVKGRLNKQIAEELGAAERTIKVHRGRVMQKMRAQSVAELVRAVEHVKIEAGPPPPIVAADGRRL